MMKKVAIAFILIAVISVGSYVVFRESEVPIEILEDEVLYTESLIGISVEGRNIESYTFGNGDTKLLFVGGIHGGYEWNSVLLAYEVIDYFKESIEQIPDNITLIVIPALNPDGLYKVINKEGRFSIGDVAGDTVPGRFNANGVDLNRNFDCKWNPEGNWRGNSVGTGTGPFSEPESIVIRDFVLEEEPEAVIFWHSSAGNVYGSECLEGVLPETVNIMNTYAEATGYGAVPSFDAYPVYGDSEGWLALINIPAITVELTTHEDVEFGKNLRGIKALLEYYTK